MPLEFKPGDFLVFQLESGFGLLRVLDVGNSPDEIIWHLAAYNELFPDVDSAEAATQDTAQLTLCLPHAALTNRAFESTQVARIGSTPLTADELKPFADWRSGTGREVSDRSIRLMLGLR